MNVFALGSIGAPDRLIEILQRQNPGVQFERNFEQIIGMAKLGELERLCLYMDVWNCAGGISNSLRGQAAAGLIHEIDPDIPILVWSGREYDCPYKDMSSAMQLWGKPLPITKANELYLEVDDYGLRIPAITKRFFEAKLSESDVPIKQFVSFSF